MELRHLRYFLAVAEELHFGRAAEHLHIVQPALSKQIAALEKELGVRLLERTKRRVELTEAGRAFLDDARNVLAQAEMAADRARSAGRGERGVLVIGFIPPALNSVLPIALNRYRCEHPNVRLVLRELTNRAAIDGVLSDRIHISFVRVPFDDHGGLNCEPVYEEPVFVALPSDHPLTAVEAVPLAALCDEPFVMIPRSQEPELHDYYIALCQEAGFSPHIVHEVSATLVGVGLVASGVGVSLVPSSTRVMSRAGVTYRPLRDPTPRFRLAAVWRPDVQPLLKSFLATRPWSTPVDGGRVRHLTPAV
ncbi:MAG TPA: LysR substrate-binding domain-containing protein [Streptosporangiaceae bacterium]